MASTKKDSVSIWKLLLAAVYILCFPVLLLLLSGDWLWAEGLIFSVWFIALCAITISYLVVKNPSLLAERFTRPGTKGQKKWDVFVTVFLVIGFIGWIVIMPLDAKRFGWTSGFPVVIKIVGGILLIPSALLFIRSYMDNNYLSDVVRIQKDRKQTVVTTGVYSIVRHPMYLGATLLFIGAPLLMGSFYGALLGVFITIVLAGRSVGEEKMLVEELDGYREYKKKVKYRLIPFIW